MAAVLVIKCLHKKASKCDIRMYKALISTLEVLLILLLDSSMD